MSDRWERRGPELYLMPERIGFGEVIDVNLAEFDKMVAAANEAETLREENARLRESFLPLHVRFGDSDRAIEWVLQSDAFAKGLQDEIQVLVGDEKALREENARLRTDLDQWRGIAISAEEALADLREEEVSE